MGRPDASTRLLVRPRCWAAALGLTLLALQPASGAGAAGLFDSEEELAIVLEFPVRDMLRGRQAKDELPATLHYLRPDGSKASLPIKVRARGRTRLRICDFPPLRLEFDAAHTAGTPFEGQGGLKLVTACKAERRYRDYVRLEQAIYRAYALLSPVSFRTRALEATYVDPREALLPLKGPAFLIEDVDDVARRNGLRKQSVRALGPADVDAAQVAALELFQYMIGNTDWSVHLPTDGEEECCHNVRVLGPKGGGGPYALVPFDFDQTGLVDAEYAAVTPGIGVRRVRQRIYRGLCSRNAEVPAAIARFIELRPRIEALFATDGLGPWASRRAIGYLERFYDVLGSPSEVQTRIYGACRPDPEMASVTAGTGAVAMLPAPASASSFGRLP
jgi:hypothetical protein